MARWQAYRRGSEFSNYCCVGCSQQTSGPVGICTGARPYEYWQRITGSRAGEAPGYYLTLIIHQIPANGKLAIIPDISMSPHGGLAPIKSVLVSQILRWRRYLMFLVA